MGGSLIPKTVECHFIFAEKVALNSMTQNRANFRINYSERSRRIRTDHLVKYASDPERRLLQHNDPAYPLSKTTKRFQGPWELLWARQCSDRGSAMKLETTIKKRGIGRYLSAQSAESR